MGKGLPRTLGRGRKAVSPIVKSVIKLKDFPLTISGGVTAVGFGTAIVGDFAQGNILYLGAVANLQAFSADTDLGATYNLTAALGTAPTADNALAGAEVDLIAAAAFGAATARLSPVARLASAVALTGTIFDNTDGSLEINLNCTVPDADIADSQSAIVLFNGTIYVSYVVLGDD